MMIPPYNLRYFRVAVKYGGAAKIDIHDIAGILQTLGYSLLQPLPPRIFKASFGGSGPLAVKGNITVDVNTEKCVVGVSSPDPSICLVEFERIDAKLKERFEILRVVDFYELLVELEVELTNKLPLQCMQELIGENKVLEILSKALNEKLKPFGFRAIKADALPNEPEWIEIELVPNIQRVTSALLISIVYRSREFEKVRGAADKLNPLIEGLKDLDK